VFAALDRLDEWLRARPKIVALLERSDSSGLTTLPDHGDASGPSGHAIIVGYGRVGSVVGRGLRSRGLAVVAVEQDRRRAEELRDRGIAAIYGDASTPGVLAAAGIERARLVVIATPEGFRARRIIELAREAKPAIDIAVR